MLEQTQTPVYITELKNDLIGHIDLKLIESQKEYREFFEKSINELALIIKDTVATKDELEAVRVELREMITDEIKGVKDEINGMRSEVRDVKDEIYEMKSEIKGMKDEIGGVKGEITGIKADIYDIKGDMKCLATKEDIKTMAY